ncbi:TPA: hypothetical protein NQN63_000271 [Legionella pneumophila]|nr:hypothetical protein [Legionella pneumophila]
MINLVDHVHLDLNAIEAQLQLDKKIVVGDFNGVERITGHFCDYLDSANSFVTLCATRDSNLLLWKSDSLLDYCRDNFNLNVRFTLSFDDLSQCTDIGELELWSTRNRFILHKSKEEINLTYYFTLLDSHQVTGELIVAPIIYFDGNPAFKIDSRDLEVLQQLFKMTPLVVEIKRNQIICFDKYHYQFAYSDDFYFIRVNNANRIN